ncbi:tyrosine-protein phosphatase [Isobaculum melis]|uniref:Protein-tyrosine phosphatase n=1 Tax=Isobaculum melis TaxID=142588 RepID=A0A1H9Q3J9_9LACT|nr:tyrosine-protein phosphatase [Isobaculum melis]SER54675.1 protein-tyrosine phosphatase [Isobaculum melis]
MKAYTQPYTIPQIAIQREGDKIRIAHEHSEGQTLQLYMGAKPNLEAIQKCLAEIETGDFTVKLPVAEGPYYFIIKGENFQTNIFSERVLQLNQAINVRDMGGYETEDGKFTKWGLLYRGDQLSKLDQEDIALLEKMNIKTIVDYRSNHERNINPNREIETVNKTVHCDPQSSFSEAAANAVDLNEENVKLVRQLEEGKVDPKYINGKGENVINDYRSLITSEAAKIAYSKFLKTCADTENPPLIHHCRGGKDRTGMGSLFLLMLLGVKEEEIIEDYILTGIIRKERNQLKYELYQELTDNENYLAYLMAMIETRKEFIQAAIDRIKELYPATDDYFIQHFDLTAAEIQKMRDFYLEEGAKK